MTSLAVALLVASAMPAAAWGAGTDRRPVMGWSSWSFLRRHVSAGAIKAQARALRSSGLAKLGYRYVNVDDNWYSCPAGGPAVDHYGRWIPNARGFPHGIKALARYVHGLGLKFGLYVTPGISQQAVSKNAPIQGTPYHADDIATSAPEHNFNCHGMVHINYAKPGAQAFVNSWAREFASWGVDYLKLDGVGPADVADVKAWSRALRASRRSIHLELSSAMGIRDVRLWRRYADGWRTGKDIECYCSGGKSSYPLTDWRNVFARFDQVAAWAPYGGRGGFNDYDSIEVGNGSRDGLTVAERKTQLSLWALAASPLILGSDLTDLNRVDRSLLHNTAVVAVDQDSIDARRVIDRASYQVFAKREHNGDLIVGLFNTSSAPERITVTGQALGLQPGRRFELVQLWDHHRARSDGHLSALVPAHGVALYRVRAL
jgi:hypothetical protein